MIVRYLDPKNDIVFKKIFGTEKNKDILIHFLNDVLCNDDKQAKIQDVKFLSPIQDPAIKFHKQSVVDVMCTDELGVMFIVEMQVAKIGGFEKRAQYYGDSYSNVKGVICLTIADYIIFPDKLDYRSDHIILDKATREHNLKDFSFTFIELPKFKKNKVEELSSYEEKWCYFFKHSHKQEDMVDLIANSDEVIKKAYDVLRSHNWNDLELAQYEELTKVNMDAKARELYVTQEAREEGLKEGRQEAIERVVISMLKQNLSIELISQVTNLSAEQIKKFKAST